MRMAPQIELFANLSQQFRWKKSIFAKYIYINQATVTVDYEIVKKRIYRTHLKMQFCPHLHSKRVNIKHKYSYWISGLM